MRLTNQQRAERRVYRMPTLAAFNAELEREGIKLELRKGRGYLYWVTLDPLPYDSRSEYVFAFNQLSADEWKRRTLEVWEELQKFGRLS